MQSHRLFVIPMAYRRFGAKGEWWVVAQFILIPAVLVASVVTRAGHAWPILVRLIAFILGAVCLLVASLLGVGGVLHLGRNLTAVPRPVDDGVLVQSGAYATVRHPIYAAIIFGVVAWALCFGSLLGLALTLVVFAFFDQKARREEAWLLEKYTGYASYRRRVRKLIPFVY